MVVAQQHGVNALRDNPESMGTSLDMLRRAANTLANLARHKDNRYTFLKIHRSYQNLLLLLIPVSIFQYHLLISTFYLYPLSIFQYLLSYPNLLLFMYICLYIIIWFLAFNIYFLSFNIYFLFYNIDYLHIMYLSSYQYILFQNNILILDIYIFVSI